MEKSEAIRFAVDLMKPLIEKGEISLTSGVKDKSKDVLSELKEITKGIIEIEKKF